MLEAIVVLGIGGLAILITSLARENRRRGRYPYAEQMKKWRGE